MSLETCVCSCNNDTKTCRGPIPTRRQMVLHVLAGFCVGVDVSWLIGSSSSFSAGKHIRSTAQVSSPSDPTVYFPEVSAQRIHPFTFFASSRQANRSCSSLIYCNWCSSPAPFRPGRSLAKSSSRSLLVLSPPQPDLLLRRPLCPSQQHQFPGSRLLQWT